MDRKRATNALIGSPIERIEDFRFLTGRGQYVDDLAFEDMLHAVIMRSPRAHGRIRSIGKRAALARPGVHAVITAADIGALVPTIPLRQEASPEFKPFEQPVIAHGKVRYVGEPVAVVLAATQAAAEDALDAMELDIADLPAVVDSATAAKGDILLFEEAGRNVALTLTGVRGDPEAAFKHAPYTRRAQFKVQRHGAVPMEPRGLLAQWNAEQGRMTVYGAAKVAFVNRRILAKQMGLPEDAIRMVENDVGGGFGARGEFYPEDYLIPFAARFTGRPVKWIEDRREHLLATNHSRDAACELEIACDRDGTILALRGRATTDQGAYIRTNGPTPARNIAQVLPGPYRIPHVRIDVSLIMTNKTPVGTYRGPGRFEADFFRERLLDIAAGELGIDRVEFRRKNLIARAEMPYPLPTVGPLNIASETDSGDYGDTLNRCLDEIDWPAKSAMDGKLIDGCYRGTAIGCYLEGGASGPKESARLVLEEDGRVCVHVGSSSIGQGLETSCAQIAADALELPLDAIKAVLPRLHRSMSSMDMAPTARAPWSWGETRSSPRPRSFDNPSVRPRQQNSAARQRTSSSMPESCGAPPGSRSPWRRLPASPPRRALPATSALTAMVRMPRTSRSTPRPAVSRCSITSRSRTLAASSTRLPCMARSWARLSRGWAAQCSSISSTMKTGNC